MSHGLPDFYKPTLFPFSELTVTLPSPSETDTGALTYVPIGKPAEPQISFTISSTDFPSFDRSVWAKYKCMLWVAGRNADVATPRRLYYEVYVNDSLRASGYHDVTEGYYWTLNVGLADVSAGDIVDVYLWTEIVTAIAWRYWAYCIEAGSLAYVRYACVIAEFIELTARELTLWNPGVASTGPLRLFEGDYEFTTTTGPVKTTLVINKEWRFKTYYGDGDTDYHSVTTSDTYAPYYRRDYEVSHVRWTK